MASPDRNIYDNPIVIKLQSNKGRFMNFEAQSIENISANEKLALLKSYYPLFDSRPMIKLWRARYIDKRVVKEFYSSKGAALVFDNQTAGISLGFNFAYKDKTLAETYQKAYNTFNDLKDRDEEIKSRILECEEFLKEAKPAVQGKYTVILSPLAAGVFAHESFGHKSEADFMTGDETMKREWAIGKKVGADLLSIVDDGSRPGSGYTPFDDEGTKAECTYLVKNGMLAGRLHSSTTAAFLEEEPTGNARAINFEFEPIVRMTTTFILPGEKTQDELFSEVKEGIFVKTIKHGSGMSTFTLAPSLSYMIRDGRIAEPVNIAVITGNVMETLGEIDGLSNKLELLSFVTGGCGKMEQYPLPVGFGGPYVRVRNMNVQ
jgi:TldD protein